MSEIDGTVRRSLAYIGLVGLMAGLTAWLVGYRSAAFGLLLGSLTGMASFVLLRYQMRKCVQLAPRLAAAYIQTGWFIRLGLIVAMLVISIVLPQISFIAALCGLLAVWIFLLAAAIGKLLKSALH